MLLPNYLRLLSAFYFYSHTHITKIFLKRLFIFISCTGHRFSRQWLFILEKMEINGSNPHLNGNGNHSSGDSKVALNGKSSKIPTFINHGKSASLDPYIVKMKCSISIYIVLCGDLSIRFTNKISS